MNLLPIVERELRVNARKPSTYVGRTMMGAVCTVVGLGTSFAIGSGAFSNRMGMAVFSSIAGMMAMFSMFAGAGSTSDCISSEKREGTLGLLFLTHLRPYDIVLGKFVACSVMSFYGIMAVFPILTLGVLLGGVQFLQVTHMAVALLNILFFSAAWGVFTSCLSRRPDRAGGSAMGGAVFFWMGCAALTQSLTHLGVLPGVAHVLRVISPQTTFEIALGAMNAGAVSRFWPTLLCSHALGWCFLIAACLVLPRIWQDRPGKVNGLPWGERMAQWRLGSPEDRAHYRRRGLDLNPYFWLSTREFHRPRHPWYFLGLLVLVVGILLVAFHKNLDLGAVAVTAVGTMHLVMRLWIASEATQRLAQERQNGTLELILSTPIKVDEILAGHWVAMRRMFAAPLAGVIVLDALFYLLVISGGTAAMKDAPIGVLLLGGIIILVLDSAAMVWQGLWAGLSEKRVQAVGGNVILRVLFLPWFLLFLVLMVGALMKAGAFAPGGLLMGAMWFGFSVVNAICWLVRARRKLATEFRMKAMERFLPEDDRPGFWKRAGRWAGRQVARLKRR